MKKTTLTLGVLILAASLAMSQSLTKGFKGGFNSSTIGGADAHSPDPVSRSGFSAGVFFNLSLPGPISIQPEVLYSMKGADAAQSGITSSFVLAYIEIPVLFKFNIPLAPGSPAKPNIFAGPAVGVLVTAKVKSGSQEMDIKDQLAKTDYGVTFGAGVDIDLVAILLTIDARYTIGIVTIDKEDPVTHTTGDIKNRVMSVNVGISL